MPVDSCVDRVYCALCDSGEWELAHGPEVVFNSINMAGRYGRAKRYGLMKSFLAVILGIFSCVLLLSGQVEVGDGWAALFDGRSFDGWTFDVRDGSPPEAIWSIEDGTLLASGAGKPTSVIRTEEEYGNYQLEFEWRWPGKPGNSGLLLHCSSPRRMNVWPQSLEVQLQNGNAGDLIMIGESIEVPEAQVAKAPKGSWKVRLRHNLTDDSEKPPGEWNQMRVVADGGTVTAYVNGELVNRGTNCSVEKGAICLQSERANVQFRNIRLRGHSSPRRE